MDRPYVTINVAATADGKIDTFERKGSLISSEQDKERVDRMRAQADAIMVGGNTLHHEDPKLTIRSELLRAERLARGLPSNPAKVSVASRLSLKRESNFLNAGGARIFIFTTRQSDEAQLGWLRSLGVQVFVLGETQVDLAGAMRELKKNGINRLMVEGGGKLNFELMQLGLVDELSIYVAPMIFGGETAPTLAGGTGLGRDDAIPLKLVESEAWADGGVLLRYHFDTRSI